MGVKNIKNFAEGKIFDVFDGGHKDEKTPRNRSWTLLGRYLDFNQGKTSKNGQKTEIFRKSRFDGPFLVIFRPLTPKIFTKKGSNRKNSKHYPHPNFLYFLERV